MSMPIARLHAFAAAGALALTGALHAQQAEPPPLSRADQAFVAQATGDNAFQIALARRVLSEPPSTQARQLAQDVYDDHTRLNAELAKLATRRHTEGASPPSPVKPTRDIDQHLAGLRGDALAKAFAGLMIRDHRGVIPVFEREAAHGDDPRLRDFAKGALPVLRRHLEMAGALQAGRGEPAAQAVLKPPR